jgi:Ca-activated chloride channel homolog
MTHSLTLTTRLDRSHIPASGGTVNLLLQLSAPGPAAPTRLPLNLAAVVDRSGSMHGPKLAYTKQALLFLVDQTAESDRLAVITYDDQVQTLLPSQPVAHKDPLKALLARIESGGSTNLSGGLATGMQQIAPHAGADRLSRVLIMTDGLANVGVTDPDTLVGWVRTWRQRGVALSTRGVGDDFNEDLLVAMAEAGGGNFQYIADPDQIPAIFAKELDGLLSVAAQALQLQVAAEPGVAIEGVMGYPPSGSAHAVSLTLPDLYGGEVKSLLIRLAVAAPPADGKLMRLTLSYLPATADATPQTVTVDVGVGISDDPALLAAPPDAEVDRQVKLAESAEAREEAVRLADQGDLHAGAQRLAEAAQVLESLAVAGDVHAAGQAESLRTQAEALNSDRYDKAVRKQLRHESFQARQGRSPR